MHASYKTPSMLLINQDVFDTTAVIIFIDITVCSLWLTRLK